MVVVDLAVWSRFFVKAAMGSALGRAVGLAIGGAVSTGADVAIGLSGLFLW